MGPRSHGGTHTCRFSWIQADSLFGFGRYRVGIQMKDLEYNLSPQYHATFAAAF